MSRSPEGSPFSRTHLFLIAASLLASAAILIPPANASQGPRVEPQPQVVKPAQPAVDPPRVVVPRIEVPRKQEPPNIEVVFVLDTTSSMGALIEGAKEKIWSIASEIARGKPTPVLKVGLVAFRDLGDEYVTRRFQLTRDLDAMFVNLRGLAVDGGGDTPEHVGKALGEAVSKMAWSTDPKTLKLIYLVGDAPPQDYGDGWNASTWARKAARKGIVLHAIRCGEDEDTARNFTALARSARGSFVSIQQSGGMVATATPFDEELRRLNEEIAARTVYGGGRSAREEAEGKAAAMGAMSASSAADRLLMFHRNKGAGLASTAAPAPSAGAVDLTAAPEQAAKLAEADLPAGLRGVDEDERTRRLAKLKSERAALEKKAGELSRERAQWLTENVSDKDDAFDTSVKKSLKKNAADFGIAY